MNKKKYIAPHLLKGDVFVDKIGSVSFVNDFDFPKIKRFYVIGIQREETVRAWHGHKREAKYVFAVSGNALVGAVYVDDWKNPSKKTKVHRFLLSFKTPAILYIPKGYANGFKSLTNNTKLIFFSTSSLDQSKKDDVRFESKYWDIWG